MKWLFQVMSGYKIVSKFIKVMPCLQDRVIKFSEKWVDDNIKSIPTLFLTNTSKAAITVYMSLLLWNNAIVHF